MPRNPFKTHCSLPGCRAWAIRGSDPPICSPHRSSKNSPVQGACAESSQGVSSDSTRGTSPEPNRGACAESTRGTCAEPGRGACPEPGRGACPKLRRGACTELGRGVGAPPGNQNHFIHGFYSTTLPPAEQARFLAPEGITTLDAEIALTRAALDRILDMLLTGVTPGPDPQSLDAQDYARFFGLAFL